MKRIVSTVAAALWVAAAAVQAQGTAPAQAAPASAPPAAAGPLRIGVINVERLVQESALGKEAFNRVKKLNDQKKEEGEKLQKELRDLEQKLADQGSALADDKRETLQKSYQEKAISFKRFQDDATRDLDAAQKKELGDLERRIFPVINQVGKEKGYTMIFNKFQAGLLYADEAVDLTDEVLKVFNTTVAVPAAKPADTNASKAPAAGAKNPAPAPAPTKKP
jgi:outer membrane protein